MDEAVATFSKVLESDSKCHEALTWMAVLTKDPQNMSIALGYAERAVKLRPKDATGHGALGSGFLSANQPEKAIESLSLAIELAPDIAEHRHNLALAHLLLQRNDEAIAQLRHAISIAPKSPQSYLTLASTYSLFGMAGQAIECLSEGLLQLPKNAQLHSAIAGGFAMIGNDEAAEHHHRRALELSPDSRSSFGTWLLNQGRFKEANTFFEAMIQEGTDPAFAYYSLMQSRKLTDSEADNAFVTEMVTLLRSGSLRPRSEMYLRYGLGRAEEQLKRFESAMEHFDAANLLAYTINRTGSPVTPARFAGEHKQARELYESLQPLEANPLGPNADSTDAPIFIIGMIRSGTTLLDQIVSSHPSVASGGELRFWIEESRRLVFQKPTPTSEDLYALAEEYSGYARLLTGRGDRITDKMPLNFACAGIIASAMPKARFLHIRRNPIDTCLSIWTTYFGQGAIFAYDKTNIVAYYREYQKMMDYWREKLPSDRLLEIDYEELISSPASVVPMVIEFLGLPWDEACLHHDQNQSAINTPSRWQARQPIYKTSIERWRNYEPWLGAFAELLPVAQATL